MMKNYKVSVCVPVYGVEKFIERCARSLFEQTYENIEFVFVNDCTKDNSISILQRVIEDYPKRKDDIRIINHVKNKGLAGTRNTAVENATGMFIMWVDSDDYIDIRAVELSVNRFLETGADIVKFNGVKYQKGYVSYIHTLEYGDVKSHILAVLKREAPVCIWGSLILRDLYVNNNIKAEEGVNMGEDYQVFPRLLYYARKTSSLDLNLYHYDAFTNEESVSHSFTRDQNRQMWRAYDILVEFFGDKGEEYLDALKTSLVSIVAMNLVISVKSSFRQDYYSEAKKRLSMVDKKYWKGQPLTKRLMFYMIDMPSILFPYIIFSRYCLHKYLSIKCKIKNNRI